MRTELPALVAGAQLLFEPRHPFVDTVTGLGRHLNKGDAGLQLAHDLLERGQVEIDVRQQIHRREPARNPDALALLRGNHLAQ